MSKEVAVEINENNEGEVNVDIEADVAIVLGDEIENTDITNRRSAFTQVYRIRSPLYDDDDDNNNGINNNISNREEQDNHNNDTESELGPGVQRISGPNMLPRAYPVPNDTSNSYVISSLSCSERRRRIDNNNNNNTTDNDRNTNNNTTLEEDQNKKCYEINWMTCFVIFLSFLILLNIILIILKYSTPFSSSTTMTPAPSPEHSSSTGENSSNYMKNETTVEDFIFSSEEKNHSSFTLNNNNSDNNNNNTKDEEINNDNYTCFTDPMHIHILEWDYYERGEDLSQKRTYIICPHTFMDSFAYRSDTHMYILTSGEVFPLNIFLPNVHVKCGLDGSLGNNCTFSGGFFHVLINDTPIFVNYKLPKTIKKENITIEGFRFTQARNSVNILTPAEYTNITIRNCLFDNNHQMYASIRVTTRSVLENRAHIDNCTFVNNTYYHNPERSAATFVGWLPTIAIIIAYPLDPYWDLSVRSPEDPDTMIVDLSVSNCVFYNNVFLSKSDTVIAAVINLLPPFTSLSVTDSCFVENEGYTSGVISIAEGDTPIFTPGEPTTQFYSGNHFIGNIPKEEDDDDVNNKTSSSCILSRQHIYFNDDGVPERSELQEECEEYIDTAIIPSSSDMMCFRGL